MEQTIIAEALTRNTRISIDTPLSEPTNVGILPPTQPERIKEEQPKRETSK
jgi:hypothetical protein